MLGSQQNRRGGLFPQASVCRLSSRLDHRTSLVANEPLVLLAREELVSRRTLGARGKRWTALARLDLPGIGEDFDAPLGVAAQALQALQEVVPLAFQHVSNVRLVAEDRAESQRDDGFAGERTCEDGVVCQRRPLEPL